MVGTRIRTRTNRHGAAAVEFALVCPLFLLLVIGMIAFGRVIMVRHVIQCAVSQAARDIAVNDNRQENPFDQNRSKQEALDRAREAIIKAGALAGVKPTVAFKEVPRRLGSITVIDTRVTTVIPYKTFSIFPIKGDYTETSLWQTENRENCSR